MKYEHRKIGEFCKVIGGYAFKSGDFTNSGVPVLKIKNISDKSLLLDSLDFLPERFLEIPDKYKVSQGDVLISMTGSHITMPASAVGRVARSRCDDIFLLNQRVGKMQVDKSTCSLDYLYYCMTSAEFKEQIGLCSRGAANQANVSGSDIEGIEIPFPILPIQKKIAGILSAYDDLIENNLRRIKLLEEMAQITYEEWFVRLRFPGHESTSIIPETGLPEGWTREPLSKIGNYLNGYSFKPEDLGEKGLPIIKIKELKGGVIADTPRNTGQTIPDKYLVETGDLLFSWSASLEVVIWQYEQGLLNQHLFKVTPEQGISKPFLFLSLKEALKIFDALTTGATMKHIKRKELDFVQVIVPCEKIMNKFDLIVGTVVNEVLNLSKQNQRLSEARDILLPRLMTSVIDVESYDPTLLLEQVN